MVGKNNARLEERSEKIGGRSRRPRDDGELRGHKSAHSARKWHHAPPSYGNGSAVCKRVA